MTKPLLTTLALAVALTASGCAMLEPQLPAANATIPADWPLPPTTAAAKSPATANGSTTTGTAAAEQAVADIGWRDFFSDPKLEDLIARALDNNRDLRVAVLNVERARSLYGIQRADRFPSVAANAGLSRTGGNVANPGDVYSAAIGVGFELDLFGRVHNLSQAALQQYFAQEEARRSAQLALIAEIAGTYLALAADMESQRVAQATLDNQQKAYDLVVKRHDLGAVSALDLAQSRTTVESARADAARYAGLVATGTNALRLLVGAPVDAAMLPQGFDIAVSGIAPLPAQLPAQVLLRRPDVQQAEHLLRSANANIGAARAAFFPSISLTGSVGTASNELSGLFGSGTRIWSFIPQITLPIFQGGRLRANLGVATADRDIALARFEKSIQAGFREVADALALTRSLADRRTAQQALLDAASRAHDLSKVRYDQGRDSFLNLLDAQRSLYAAQQGLVSAQLAEQANRVTLYKVLGGGWMEQAK
ncbi:efflux transporter outer membrane subunit [Janthinobacterium sp. 17J80-10]|uniref:efflux transporter outer membrane subunit n=1 Tax=Janthinobacterium sp. 17J80-10 TaxID=2497863 RepID=UPI0010055964|nr:efflux transporter outer membrane subunit [Janthinobacterium sp. 17J80-10]QAU34462.1 efflux transporter outer membrane subunit [Janthinobacterium sp. 17J80-10]